MVAMTVTRARGLRSAVRVHKWAWLENDPPWDLPFREIFNEASQDIEFKNAFSGTQTGLEFVACDCIFGSGRYSTLTSTVAVRSPHNPFGAGLFEDTTVVQCGDWWAIRPADSAFRTHRRMGVTATVAMIESIGGADATTQR
jgi:hypothetical protein